MSEASEIEQLRAKVRDLEAKLAQATTTTTATNAHNPRERITRMTAEVVDSNPYR